MTSNKSIIVSNLTRQFGDFTAVDCLSFEVGRGEVFGFLGANGAGKTTAIRMLCGLLRPTGGSAIVAGYDVARQPDMLKQNIGYMSQRFSLYDDMTVNENIELFGTIYGLNRKSLRDRMASITSDLGLEGIAREMVRDIPPGWKQKVALASAMLHRPGVLFLDEPTGGVDPLARRQFWDLILSAAADGTTILVTTHYLDEALYCDRTLIMADGELKALDRPRSLMSQYNVKSMDELFERLTRPATVISNQPADRSCVQERLPEKQPNELLVPHSNELSTPTTQQSDEE